MKVSTIIVFSSLSLAVLFLALTTVWAPFCLFASFAFLCGVSILAFNSLKTYLAFKAEIKEQRFVDAYLYAENNQLNSLKDFKYDKKTEKNIKSTKRNLFTSLFTMAFLFVLAIILIIIAIKITFFG